MREPIALEHVSPSNCSIGFAIPTTIQQYRRQALQPDRHRFGSKVSAKESDYRWAVLRETDRLLPAMRRTGVNVIEELTLDGFSAALHNETRRVFILVAHWERDSIEFSDGLVSISRVIDSVPYSFDGMLDLCVCHPSELAQQLRRKRPNIGPIAWMSGEARLLPWLYFYLAVFKSLAIERRSYPKVLGEQLRAFFDANEVSSI